MKSFCMRGVGMALAAALLSGCAAAVVGGAVGTGVLLSSAARRSGDTQQADQTIEAPATTARP